MSVQVGRQASILALGLALAISAPAMAQNETALSRYLAAQTPAVVFISSTLSCDNGLIGGPFEGSGVVVSREGVVLTAAHVIDGIPRGAQSRKPTTCTGAKYRSVGTLGSSLGEPRELKLVAIDDARDLAMLRFVTVDDYHAFQVASADGLARSEGVLALGIPIGSAAVVAAQGSITDQTRTDKRWLVDAPVNPGHSGGAVVRRDGKLIGIVNAGVEGVALMNLIVPLEKSDALLTQAHIPLDVSPWRPAAGKVVPERSVFNDIPPVGSCEERRPAFESLDRGVHWLCAEKTIERGVKASVHIIDTVAVTVPASAAILDVRYFHRTRGDYRNPDPSGPWYANAPGDDLQWMKIGKAAVTITGVGDGLVAALCDNWSADLQMHCAIGVQYQADARVW